MQPYLVRFASFSVFNKNFGFERRHESKLVVPHKWDNFELNSCISIGELVKPLHKKNLFQKNYFCCHICHLLKLCLSFFLEIVYKMSVIIIVFIYFDNFCYDNQLTSMLGFLYFIIYYLIPYNLRKHVTNYLCYPGMSSIIYFLNFVNMLVIVK